MGYGIEGLGQLTPLQGKGASKLDLTDEASIVKVAKTSGGYKKTEKAAQAKGINLTDLSSQKFNMKGWLKNAYSGYPTLLANIARLLGGKRIKGKRPALITINGTLTNNGKNPISKGDKIDSTKLKHAIIVRWAEKGNTVKGLDKINSVKDVAAINAVWKQIIK